MGAESRELESKHSGSTRDRIVEKWRSSVAVEMMQRQISGDCFACIGGEKHVYASHASAIQTWPQIIYAFTLRLGGTEGSVATARQAE